jgi:NAD(P)-dependent dehydrogenase (short-subunit alcohol dehydrogenase family)
MSQKKYHLNKGKVLITGGTSGLGYELVKRLHIEGYEVFTTGRNSAKLSSSGGNLHFLKIDFSDLNSVTSNIQELLNRGIRFDLVINNAGVLSPPGFTASVNGIEYSFQVNFLSHLLINDLIIRDKDNSDPLTFVSITSPVYRYVRPDLKLPDSSTYKSFKSYSESKLYLLYIGDHLLKMYPGSNAKFICFDPGTFRSGIYRMQKSWFHNMYSIAAPFMRNPSRIAAVLADILNEENLINGAVYSGRHRFRKPDPGDEAGIDEFMAKCNGMIKAFTI